MLITHPEYLKKLKALQKAYEALPWYQRLWFSFWSYRLSSALLAIDFEHPTSEQVQTLYDATKKAWFFESIFGLLEHFKKAVLRVPFVKEGPLHQLPELSYEIGNDLTTMDLLSFVQSSKTHAALFQPILDARKLLHHVTRGEYDAVEAMLKKDSTLLTKKGHVTDYSGRTFTNISGFEYALWALDKHMWTRMLHCIPKDEQGEKIKVTLLAQYEGIKEHGITYTLKDAQPVIEKHFDFENTIVRELQTQINVYDNLRNLVGVDLDFDILERIDKQWVEGVGGAQKLLPMHVVYEYCSGVPFDPLSSFTMQPTLNKHFYNGTRTNGVVQEAEYWFHKSSQLGHEFALYKNSAGFCFVRQGFPRDFQLLCANNLAAMQALCAARTKEFMELNQYLLPSPQMRANQALP